MESHYGHEIVVEKNVPIKKYKYYEYVVNLTGYSYHFQRRIVYGRVGMRLINYGLLETHSRLDEILLNAGWGIRMYAEAIKFACAQGYDICSSHIDQTLDFRISEDAERVWKSNRLRKACSRKIELIDGRYRVI